MILTKIAKHICAYGCGKEANYQFKNGRWCCSKFPQSCGGLNKKIKKSLKGREVWNKNKKNCYNKKTLNQMSESRVGKIPWNKGKQGLQTAWNKNKEYTINQIKKKYPTFAKIEEMRYNPDKYNEKEIQVHCKNHNCPNSKEQNGWFTLINRESLKRRIYAIEKDDGNDGLFLYCSEKCKHECPLYGKHITQLIKLDQINSGNLKEPWYSSVEYQTWRNQVFELDNNKCVWCGEKATIVHHILPQKTHPELSLDPENGLSSCQSCHMKYGHRDRWCTTGYLGKLVCERLDRVKEKFVEIIKRTN